MRQLIFYFFLFLSVNVYSQTLFLNEVMSNNIRLIDDQGENEDWIEIYNASSGTINLSNYFLTDDINEPDKWQFPVGSHILPLSFRLIWADNDMPENEDLHCNFKLSKEGELIYLMQENGTDYIIIDQLEIPALYENTSYGRTTDGADDYTIFGKYSPSFSNNENLPFNAEEVVFSLNSGYYTTGTTLTLSSSNAASEIYYTTNGKRPNQDDILYTGIPITLDSSVFIRATVCTPNFAPSVPAENFYLIDENYDIPVIHIGTDSINLWDDYAGIYTRGENGVQLYCSDEERNWNQPWKRQSTVTFFEEDGEIGFSKLAEIKISGNCSRAYKMKSINVTLENNETTEYPLFEHLPYTNYRQFKLRNSGNDSASTMLRDGAIQTILQTKSDIDLMAYRPVMLYINGSYFGIYGLREVMNGNYVEQHHGVEEANIFSDIWGWAPEILSGDREDLDILSDWIYSSDLSTVANYEYLNSQVDVSEFINYYLTEIYIANTDWPGNNVRMWRDVEQANGKWRWMLFDLDLSSNFERSWVCSKVECNTLEHGIEEGQIHSKWIRKMLENPDFLAEFMQRHCTFGQSVFGPERVEQLIDSLTNLVRPEVARHINHWMDQPEEMAEREWIPAGGSYEDWEERIENFKSFFSERFSWTLDHFSMQFDNWEYFDLQINVEDSEQGKVVLHENKMAIASNYSGRYFKHIPMRVEAIPAAGYRFVKWVETESFEPIFYLSSNRNQSLTPIFVEEENYFLPLEENASIHIDLFPNPALSELNYVIGYGRSIDAQMRIINSIGQVVWKKDLNLERHLKCGAISLNNWTAGVYYLKLIFDNEELVKKVVVL